MASSLQPDPWCFGNDAQRFFSLNQEQALEYGTLNEFGQGGPVGGSCYWVAKNKPRILVHDPCGGPPAWELMGLKVALPVWEQHWLHGTIARVGVLNTVTAQLTIFAPWFRVPHLLEFKGLYVKGVDSPVYNAKGFIDRAINTHKVCHFAKTLNYRATTPISVARA